eukprot:TRINITY_DN6038_c0_g1_i2.p1 TRINITY_DN6038_c0_g1~~TRINITY_DN6038_c0_g1_i2.p1  ORF type:complete len:115 (-),score=4.79 TRINITY_DN6038_c0_g1_i2:290-634(-)
MPGRQSMFIFRLYNSPARFVSGLQLQHAQPRVRTASAPLLRDGRVSDKLAEVLFATRPNDDCIFSCVVFIHKRIPLTGTQHGPRSKRAMRLSFIKCVSSLLHGIEKGVNVLVLD